MDKNKEVQELSSPYLVKQGTMKAALITRPQTIEFSTVQIPKPSDNEVLIKIEGCGICGSDLPVWQGREWFNYPREAGAPGHEGYGVIEKTGSNVTSFQVGDRVAMLSYHAYAQYDVANSSQVVKLPDELSKIPFPGEPLGCAMNIFKRSQITESDTVAVIGAGFMGNLLIQLSKSAGAKVIAITQRDSSLNMAFNSGADHIIKMDNHYQIIDKVKEITNNNGCSRVIEATGMQWPLDLAGDLTSVRGRLIIAGYHQDGLRQVNVQNWNWKGIDVINAHERDPQEYVNGMKLAIDAVLAGRMNPLPLFSDTYKFEQLNLAFKDMAARRDGFLKAIVQIH